MSKIIELTTQLFPIISVSLYESWLDPQNMFSDDIWELDSKNLEETDFDVDTYKEEVRECANEVLQYLDLTEYGIISITMPKIWSPQSYNYTTDYGHLDVEVADDFDEWLRSKIDEFRKVEGWEDKMNKKIQRIFGSKPGFISWMPESVEEVYKLEDYERCVAVFFEMIGDGLPAHQENYDESEDPVASEFFELCNNSLSYSDFATTTTIFPEELFEMPDDKLSEIMWDLFYAGIKYPYKLKPGEDAREVFLKWCKEHGYETEEDLLLLLKKESA